MADKYKVSIPTIRSWISQYTPTKTTPIPRDIILIADATFFGKRIDKFGVLVFKDAITSKVLCWRYIQTETIQDYIVLKQELEDQGFNIKGVVLDGRRGLIQAFEGIPVQLCLFHIQATITRYLTKNPKLMPAKDLKEIAGYIQYVDEDLFKEMLEEWFSKHEAFLKEKTFHEHSNRWSYKHRRVRSAYRSLKTNIAFIFTYQKRKRLQIPTTTNGLDGGVFSPVKNLLSAHKGMNFELRKKLIDDFLNTLQK
ncbi:hypothetical protein JCM30760_12680 [Thiomicrorhabdus hydrogeniphila]